MQSIYEKIKANLVNGELDKNFSIYDLEYTDDAYTRDGARDAVTFLHERRARISRDRLNSYKKIFAEIRKGNIYQVWDDLARDLQLDGTVKLLDYLIREIKQTKESYFYFDLLDRAIRALTESDNVELVKFSLVVVEKEASNLEQSEKDIIRTLALSDELTLFTSMIISKWPDANEELFEVAKKVHGWGRVLLIPRLKLSSIVVTKWLLEDGYKNTAKVQYQSSPILNYSKLVDYVQNAELSDEEFDAFTYIMLTSVTPEPGVIRLFDLAADVQIKTVTTWLEKFSTHNKLSLDAIKLMIILHSNYAGIRKFIEEHDEDELANESDDSPGKVFINFRILQFYAVSGELDELNAFIVELYDFNEFKDFISASEESSELLFSAMFRTLNIANIDADEIRDNPEDYIKILNMYKFEDRPEFDFILDELSEVIPLVEIANGPATKRTSNELTRMEKLLVSIIAILRLRPWKGREFIIAGLQSSSSAVRYTALITLRLWTNYSKTDFHDLDPELEELIKIVYKYESKENLKIYHHDLISYQ